MHVSTKQDQNSQRCQRHHQAFQVQTVAWHKPSSHDNTGLKVFFFFSFEIRRNRFVLQTLDYNAGWLCCFCLALQEVEKLLCYKHLQESMNHLSRFIPYLSNLSGKTIYDLLNLESLTNCVQYSIPLICLVDLLLGILVLELCLLGVC